MPNPNKRIYPSNVSGAQNGDIWDIWWVGFTIYHDGTKTQKKKMKKLILNFRRDYKNQIKNGKNLVHTGLTFRANPKRTLGSLRFERVNVTKFYFKNKNEAIEFHYIAKSIYYS